MHHVRCVYLYMFLFCVVNEMPCNATKRNRNERRQVRNKVQKDYFIKPPAGRSGALQLHTCNNPSNRARGKHSLAARAPPLLIRN